MENSNFLPTETSNLQESESERSPSPITSFRTFEEFLAAARLMPDVAPEDEIHVISICDHCPKVKCIYTSMDAVIEHLDTSDHYAVKEFRVESDHVLKTVKDLYVKLDRNECFNYYKQIDEEEPLFPVPKNKNKLE